MDNSMRNLFLINIIFNVLVSCNNRNEKFSPDININDIKLSDVKTKVLGYNDFKYRVIEDSLSLPYAIFTNERKTEMLKLYLFYGVEKNDFYQIEVSPYEHNIIANPTKYNNFRTESGIMLGMSKKDLIDIKGYGFVEKDNTIRYEISDYEKSYFLQEYNLPIYFAEYTFIENKLYKFYFGFEYP